MGIIINDINYTTRATSNTTLINNDVEGQTALRESQESIDQRSYQLSERNGANAYIISTDKEKVYLNFIAQKVNVYDSDLYEVLSPEFEFFLDEIEPTIDLFILDDGIIFRCVSSDSIPRNKEDYTYFIMMNGRYKLIPNYRTLEVMLAERNQNLLSVRIIEKKQCDELIKDPIPVPDKSGFWKEEYEDLTTLEKLKEMEDKAKEAAALVDDAKAAAAEQIDAVKAAAAAQTAIAETQKEETAAAQGELKANQETMLGNQETIIEQTS